MPTQTQFAPQTTPNINPASNKLQAVSSVENDSPIQAPIGKSIPVAPVVHRIERFKSLLTDTVAIPALYGFIAPLAALCFPIAGDFLVFSLPAYLAFALGMTRKKKRSGFITGALLGIISCLGGAVVDAVRRHYFPDVEVFVFGLFFFAIIGAAIGTFSTGLRQGAIWLFAPNRP